MATCHVCPPSDNPVPGPERWPDGTVVIYDQTLSPADFNAPEATDG